MPVKNRWHIFCNFFAVKAPSGAMQILLTVLKRVFNEK